MKLKSAPASSLSDPQERLMACLAMRASLDCWNGGAKALVIADSLRDKTYKRPRLEDGRFDPDEVDYSSLDPDTAQDIVTACYHSSNPPPDRYTPFECPECGQVRLGSEAAYACCAPSEDEDFLDDEEVEE